MKNLELEIVHTLFGNSFIGPEQLRSNSNLPFQIGDKIIPLPFTLEELQSKKDDYILIYGVSNLSNGSPLTIRSLLELFGKDPNVFEPCFYNQDWYNKEDFIDTQMPEGWFFIRKSVFEESRAVLPDELEKKYSFPLAVRCVYAFFTAWFCSNERLWWHDFVWCCDRDHNGDRIYVGKYHDVDGVNKNGFSIHRHLALRPCYGAID